MNQETIRRNYPPRKVGSQPEFDSYMNQLNDEQTAAVRPIIDEVNSIIQQREVIEIEILALRQRQSALKMKLLKAEERRKETNRIFHDLKHEMHVLNPRESFTKEADTPSCETPVPVSQESDAS